MATYRDLVAWQKGIELVTAIYRATQAFPREEMYGLTSQLRRAAVSVPSNIAEGQARYSHHEFHTAFCWSAAPLGKVRMGVLDRSVR